MKKSILYILILITAFAAGFYFVNDNESGSNVIASFNDGEFVITTDEFKSNYEFGYPHLKKGNSTEERKENYLNYLLKEKLLAYYGYQKGFNKNPEVVNKVSKLKNELLIEQLIKEKIEPRVIVTQEEINDFINKSKVSFKFKLWAEPEYERAQMVKQAMDESGFEDVTNQIIRFNPEFNIPSEYLETDYLTWENISPGLLNAIKDLPAGNVSEPIFINGIWLLVKVEDIRRTAVTENEYYNRAPTVKKQLFHAKLQSEIINFVDSLITPQKVVTDGKVFRKFADEIFKWLKDTSYVSISFKDYLQKTNPHHLNETITSFTDGNISVKEMISLLSWNKLKMEYPDIKSIRNDLYILSGLAVRDHFLQNESEKYNLNESDALNDELKLWEDKWVYEEARKEITRGLQITKNDLDNAGKEVFGGSNKIRLAKISKAAELMNAKIDSLKAAGNTAVNRELLKSVEVTDFNKSRWASIQLFKGGTGRQAVPVVDPAWSL